jgi:serine/threonine protein kinase/Tol biopolymer transport system component
MRTALPDRVRLGAFEVDLRAGEVRDGEQRAILPEQAVRILRMLVEAGGELVGREEIRKKLWPNDTVVEFDHSINTAIRNLRRALGDSPDDPKYIETIPRRGYRLLVPVERLAGDDSSSANERLHTETKEPAAGDPSAFSRGHLIGKKVSHYRVLEVLGGGGMGMLYKAEDLKLGRQVALKFLPEELAADTVALQRFEREARTASSLDHPNICTIYEVEEDEGQPFIVMQLLQGETLRDKLATLAAGQKKLALDELLDIAGQICEGLWAAHTKGIVHRDIKPANIFLTSTGQAKILDFGLAKLVSTTHDDGSDGLEPALDGTAAAPQRAKSVPLDTTLTRLGVAMGTAGYMSPEQIRGEKLDTRTDIFSFGLVLYEMATGHRAFTGDTAAIVHNAIVNDAAVPARQVNPEVTPELDVIINKALEKDREQRYQTAAELRTELQSTGNDRNLPHAVVPAPAKSKRRRSLRLAIAILGTLAILLVLGLGVRRVLRRPQLAIRQVTSNSPGNRVTAGAISPDGKYVAYHDQTGLYIHTMASAETHLVGLPGALPSGPYVALLWFPGGTKLFAWVDGNGIWVMPIAGEEQPHLLYEHAEDPAISPDGQMIAFIGQTHESGRERRHELWVGNVNGDAPRKLAAAEETEYLSGPAWSPDGQWITYGKAWKAAEGLWHSAIEVCPATGGPAKTFLAESSLPKSNTFVFVAEEAVFSETWFPDWRLVFSVIRGSGPKIENSLWQVRVKPGTTEAGNPEPVTQWDQSLAVNLAGTTDNKRLSFVRNRSWVDVYAGELGSEGATMKVRRSLARIEAGASGLNSWAHDGQAVFLSSVRNGRPEIFRQRLNESAAEKIVTGPRDAFGAQISPDGAWLLYLESEPTRMGDIAGSVWLMRQPIGGGLAEKALEMPSAELDEFRCRYNPKAISPCVLALREGQDLVFYSLDPLRGKGSQLGKIAVLGFPWMRGWDVSPDGSSVAVVSAHKYGERIEVLTLANGAWHEIAAEPAEHIAGVALRGKTKFCQIAWAADGKSFFVTAALGDSFNLLHVTSDGKVQPLLANEGFQNQFMDSPLPSPDGKYLAFTVQTWDGNVWMLDNF